MYSYLKGLLLPSRFIRVQFNPEMCQVQRHATLFNQTSTDPVGIRLNHPSVLVALRSDHMKEIVRQAQLCGYEPTHLELPKPGKLQGMEVWRIDSSDHHRVIYVGGRQLGRAIAWSFYHVIDKSVLAYRGVKKFIRWVNQATKDAPAPSAEPEPTKPQSTVAKKLESVQ